MAVLVSGNEIVLSGTVGDLYWDESFSAADVISALAEVGRDRDVVVRINSGGGIATEGAAIHSALVAHKGRKTIIVEGIAASAASVIAMAGDEIVMALGALMMVHDPSGFTFGTVDDHEQQIRALTALATAMAGIYADQTGRTIDQCRADMKAELWMTPEQAVEAGYADRVQGRAANENEPEPTAFNFRLYEHPPERLVALADQRAWSKRARPRAALPAATHRQRETTMANEPAGAGPTITVAEHETKLAAAIAEAKAAPPTAIQRSEAAEIAKACVDGGVPAMAASLLAEGVTLAVAKERIGSASQIKELVALAGRTSTAVTAAMADEFIAAGKTVEQVRADLFDKLVAKQERTDVRSHVQPSDGDANPSSRIVANYRAATGAPPKTA
ncbi:head maturation protease, ClpP-related [Enterovirga sp. CN4-39]|uniref:head maturation protease, ClpP-related n=1 Tax=Enterovirga sp. CN4-39 TaxID=3400910 RepID=UPI003C04F4EF